MSTRWSLAVGGVALGVAQALAACGAFDSASDDGPGGGTTDAGAEAASDGGGPADGGSVGDAEGGVPGPLFDCDDTACEPLADAICTDDSCDNGLGQPIKTTGTGALMVSEAGTFCSASAPASGGAYAERTFSQIGAAIVDLSVHIEQVTGDAQVMQIDPGAPYGSVRVEVATLKSTFCVGDTCSDLTAAQLLGKRLFVHIGPTATGGWAATLDASCKRIATIALTEPFRSGTSGEITARIGCAATTLGCTVQFNALVFAVVPAP